MSWQNPDYMSKPEDVRTRRTQVSQLNMTVILSTVVGMLFSTATNLAGQIRKNLKSNVSGTDQAKGEEIIRWYLIYGIGRSV